MYVFIYSQLCKNYSLHGWEKDPTNVFVIWEGVFEARFFPLSCQFFFQKKSEIFQVHLLGWRRCYLPPSPPTPKSLSISCQSLRTRLSFRTERKLIPGSYLRSIADVFWIIFFKGIFLSEIVAQQRLKCKCIGLYMQHEVMHVINHMGLDWALKYHLNHLNPW